MKIFNQKGKVAISITVWLMVVFLTALCVMKGFSTVLPVINPYGGGDGSKSGLASIQTPIIVTNWTPVSTPTLNLTVVTGTPTGSPTYTITSTPTNTATPVVTSTYTAINENLVFIGGTPVIPINTPQGGHSSQSSQSTHTADLSIRQTNTLTPVSVVILLTATPTFTGTCPLCTGTPTVTNSPTNTLTPTPALVYVQPIVTIVPLGRFSVNPVTSATPAVIATAIPSATPIYHKVVASYNNSGIAGGGFGLWAPTKLNSIDVIAPQGVGSGSTALVAIYGPGQPLSISGPDCSLGSAAGSTVTGYLFDYQSLSPFPDMTR